MSKFIVLIAFLISPIFGVFAPQAAFAGMAPADRSDRPPFKCPQRYTEGDMDRGLAILNDVYDMVGERGQLNLVADHTTIVVCGLAFPTLSSPVKGQVRLVSKPRASRTKVVAVRDAGPVNGLAPDATSIPTRYVRRAEAQYVAAVRTLSVPTDTPVVAKPFRAMDTASLLSEEAEVHGTEPITFDHDPLMPAAPRLVGKQHGRVLSRIDHVTSQCRVVTRTDVERLADDSAGALGTQVPMMVQRDCPPTELAESNDDPFP